MNEVTQPGDPIKEFQESIQAKLREQIGDLMPEAMLKKIVEDSIKSILYRNVNSNKLYVEPQSWIIKTIDETIGNGIEKAVAEVLAAKQDEIFNVVKTRIEHNFSEIVAQVFMRMLLLNQNAMHNLVYQEVRNALNNGAMRF